MSSHHLVHATGTRTDHLEHGIRACRTLGLKLIEDARVVQLRPLPATRRAEDAEGSWERARLMTFTVIGG